jgi:hypothetical protein
VDRIRTEEDIFSKTRTRRRFKTRNERKAVADEEPLTARNTQLSQIATERVQIEQNSREYKTIQGTRDNFLAAIQESAMSTATISDENFLQNMNKEIAPQVHRTHLYQTKIRKYKMLKEGILTQQRLMRQQLVNQRTLMKHQC